MGARTRRKQEHTSLDIPLKSDFMNTLYETSHGNIVSVSPYRPKSVQTIYRYADNPIIPCDVGYGSPTKASILGQMARSRTAIPCTNSWVPNTEKLCKIRYYYRLGHPSPLAKLTRRTDGLKPIMLVCATNVSPSWPVISKASWARGNTIDDECENVVWLGNSQN